jgi:hypothetical protein
MYSFHGRSAAGAGVSEELLSQHLKKNNKDMLWKNISDKYGEGTPDRAFKFRNLSDVFFAELKFIKSLPQKKKKVGLRKKQAAWLEEWQEWGGRALLIVGVGDEKAVAIFDDGFYDIATKGIDRESFNLIPYDEVSKFIREKYL